MRLTRLFGSALAVGAAGLAARRIGNAAPKLASVGLSELASTRLLLVKNGELAGEAVRAESLWSEHGSLVFVVRRPG